MKRNDRELTNQTSWRKKKLKTPRNIWSEEERKGKKRESQKNKKIFLKLNYSAEI